ncbi:MAG TPA: hypothetical protein VLH60_02070 [Sedimentisphaerales bacterium]|nr:hypothetical protein [Sedimentisphaerales bacterium]
MRNSLLEIVVILAGVMIAGGIVIAVWPNTLKRICSFLSPGKRLYGIAAIRITIGIILLLAAQGDAAWWILSVLGVIILLAGITQLIMKLERQKAIMNWMAGRSEVTRRLFGIAVILIGWLMLVAVLLA